jgi:hypothetical protein
VRFGSEVRFGGWNISFGGLACLNTKGWTKMPALRRCEYSILGIFLEQAWLRCDVAIVLLNTILNRFDGSNVSFDGWLASTRKGGPIPRLHFRFLD